ncbi:MAG: hypothetical protein GY745_09660 [Actinomycetia bacterium]|nr:hypothetical protein [Actinomycetes bacterium]MCP3911261.1 hypothetical protein [Actinomycetes bacterium]MCP4085298.1 hypothetical protein [Actinomycetes bacterium]
MLRASAKKTNRPINLLSIVDAGVDPQLEWGRPLLEFTDALVLRDTDELPVARQRLLDVAGEPATVRAAGCAGNFQLMNRALDAVLAPVNPVFAPIGQELGITVPAHLTPGASA